MPANELTLDWRPLYDELYRNFIRSNADPPVNDAIGKGKDLNHLTRLARYAQKYFPASEIPAILEKVLPEVISTGIITKCSLKHISLRERSIPLACSPFSFLSNFR